MPAGICPSTQTIPSIRGRRVGICPSLLKRTYLVLLSCRSGFTPPWPSSVGLAPLEPVFSLDWPWYPIGIPWIPRISPQLLWTHTYSDLISCYTPEGYWRFLAGHPNYCLFVSFSPTCCLHKLEHSSQSGVQTSCSSTSGTLPLRSWVRMTSLCSRRALGWYQKRFSLDQHPPFWSGCILRTHPWSLKAEVLRLSIPRYLSRVTILGTGSIEVHEIYVHSSLSIGLFDHNHVCQLVRIVYLSNEICFQ